MRAEVVGIRVPEWMRDDFNYIASPAGGNSGEYHVLPLWLRGEVGVGSRSSQGLPVRNREIDGSVWVNCQPRQVKTETPIENIVEREVAEIAKTIRT